MLFTTDKQTLEDLNIFGRHGSDSVFNSFNRCTTKGGAAILEEMFRYPLSDCEEINRRSRIIQYFTGAGRVFPFQNTLFDAVEHYLANTDERTRLVAEKQSIGKKMGDLIARDAGTALIYNGIHALTELLHGLHDFINSLFGTNSNDYKPEQEAIIQLLHDPGLEPVLQAAGSKKLAPVDMVEYDTIFRFTHRNTVQKILRHIYYLDVYSCIAAIAKERELAFAKAWPRGLLRVQITGLYHLQVRNAVRNNLHLSPDGNVIFLTGANRAGKSTFMKSLSTALFLAHMGFPVPATSLEFSVFDGIYTTINLPDNLQIGASHFYAEVLRVKKIAQELQSKNLFIVFDELFRGTNVKDAYEATIAITTAFAQKTNSLFVISTHIIEAGEVLKQRCSNVRFLYLPTRMQGTEPVYTYKLEEGITNDRHGMVIIKNEGIIDILEAGIKKMRTV